MVWSHFKLKYKEFIYGLGKIFVIGENGMNLLGILPIPQNVWPKGPENYLYFLFFQDFLNNSDFGWELYMFPTQWKFKITAQVNI